MLNTIRRIVIATVIAAGVAAGAGSTLDAQGVKISDPTSVVMIVNRDSNDIGFMDIKTNKMIGNVFLGNNVNPHMVMMSPDGRYVVTGGTRANKAYIIDTRTLQLVKVIPTDIAPEHLAFSPDSRWYYQGNPDGDSISVIDMQSLSKIKTIPGFVEPLNVTFLPDGSKAYVGNYGAHWVGVIDVRRHELLKKIQIGSMPAVSKLDPGQVPRRDQGHQHRRAIDRRPLPLRRRQRPCHRRRHRHPRRQGDQDDPRGPRSVAHLHEPRRQVRHHRQQRRRDDLDHRYAGRTASRRRSRRVRT